MARRLAAEGWRHLARRPLTLGLFTRELHDGFAAVASLDWHGPATVEPAGRGFGMPDGVEEVHRLDPDASWLEVTVSVGVSYEPLRSLLQAIGGRVLVELVSEDVEDLDPPPAQPVVSLDSMSAVPAAVQQLGGMIAAYAVPFAERHAQIEKAIDLLADRDMYEPQEAAMLNAAFVVAARRWDQAGAALAELETADQDGEWGEVRRRRRIVRQLRRHLDAEGALSIPRTPASWPPVQSLPPRAEGRSFAEVWSDARRKTKAREEALAAVRTVAADMSRDEIKMLLAREQEKRGLDVEPLGLERQADRIEAEHDPLGRVTQMIGGVSDLIDLGRDMVGHIKRAVREEHEHAPPWMQPPDKAAYPITTIGKTRWAQVMLDGTADGWLARVVESASKFGPVRMVEVWLDWAGAGSESGESQMAAHIGQRRVGVLVGEPVDTYRPAMDAAAERDELPWVEGRLTAIAGPRPYLLEVPLPVLPPG